MLLIYLCMQFFFISVVPKYTNFATYSKVLLSAFLPLFNPLNAELNPICHLLALLGAHHIFHVSRLRVKDLHRTTTIEIYIIYLGNKEIYIL